MLAKVFPAAKFAAGMGHIAPVILGVLLLATEAVVFPGNLLGHVLACRTAPSVVGFGTAGPLGRAGQMQNVVAIRTGPYGLRWPHQIATDEALQLGGIQLPGEFLALRALGGNLRFQLLLAGPLPLVRIWSTVLCRLCILRSTVVIVAAAIHLRFISFLIGPLIAPIAETPTSSSVSLPSSILLRLLLLLLLRCSTGWPVIFP